MRTVVESLVIVKRKKKLDLRREIKKSQFLRPWQALQLKTVDWKKSKITLRYLINPHRPLKSCKLEHEEGLKIIQESYLSNRPWPVRNSPCGFSNMNIFSVKKNWWGVLSEGSGHWSATKPLSPLLSLKTKEILHYSNLLFLDAPLTSPESHTHTKQSLDSNLGFGRF